MQDVKIPEAKEKKVYVTCERGCGEYGHVPHCRVTRTPLCGRAAQVAKVQDPVYQVFHLFQEIFGETNELTDRFVAISTLMFPRGSNPSSWLINSNMVR